MADLDSVVDEKVKEIWIDEAQRRYEAYRAGDWREFRGGSDAEDTSTPEMIGFRYLAPAEAE